MRVFTVQGIGAAIGPTSQLQPGPLNPTLIDQDYTMVQMQTAKSAKAASEMDLTISPLAKFLLIFGDTPMKAGLVLGGLTLAIGGAIYYVAKK